MTKKSEIKTFEDFCIICCDGLYSPSFPLEDQCNGYLMLRKMVSEGISPATLEEMERWEKNPTLEELSSPPDIKYLRFLHTLLRPLIVENWDSIKGLPISN